MENCLIEVRKAPGIKCPRCWHYHTIQFNPQDVCDRCLSVVNESIPDLILRGTWTEADKNEWQQSVQISLNHWKKK